MLRGRPLSLRGRISRKQFSLASSAMDVDLSPSVVLVDTLAFLT